MLSITRSAITLTKVLFVLALALFCFRAAFADSSSLLQPSKQSWITDLAVDPAGAIYLLDNGRDELIKLDKDGKMIWRTPLSTAEIPNSNSYKLVASSRGPISYFILSNQAEIRGVDAGGQLQTLFPPVGEFTDRIMGMDGSGAIYFPNTEKHRVEKYARIMINVSSDQLVNGGWKPKIVKITDPGPRFPANQQINCSQVINGDVKGPARFARPNMVISSPAGDRIWILDQSYVFNVFDGAGKFLYEIKAPDEKNRSFTYVVDAEFDKDGNAYLASNEAKAVLEFNRSGKLVKKIPAGNRPDGFALGSDGNIYIGDNYGYSPADGTGRRFPAVKVLDQDGKLLRLLPVPLD